MLINWASEHLNLSNPGLPGFHKLDHSVLCLCLCLFEERKKPLQVSNNMKAHGNNKPLLSTTLITPISVCGTHS